MVKKTYTKSEMDHLKLNPNIVEVNKNNITYLPEFKVEAVKSSLEGKSPSSIFLENGFDLDIIGKDIPRKRLYVWRQIYDESGELGLLIDNRGRKGIKTNSKELSVEEKLKKAEAKIKFLEIENEFLKKLDELERQATKKKQN